MKTGGREAEGVVKTTVWGWGSLAAPGRSLADVLSVCVPFENLRIKHAAYVEQCLSFGFIFKLDL